MPSCGQFNIFCRETGAENARWALRQRPGIRGVALAFGLGASAWLSLGGAHHFFATEYEDRDMVTIRGVVTEVRYRNPHVQLLVAVTGEDGEVEVWAANTVSPRSLPRRGWEADTVRSGDALTLHGNLGRDGTKRLWIQTLSLDGREPIYPVGRAP